MSPPIPAGGFTAGTTAWTKVWTATDYEPDAVTASTYGTGALASFDGYLYWGTMQVPGRGALVHDDYYPPPADQSQEQANATFMNTLRAITIFRGRNFGTSPQKQVVYGQAELPTWVPDQPGAWENEATGMGAPLWGPSGFGNPLNNYTWTMDVYNGSLYIGTMDFGYLARQNLTPEQSAALEGSGYSYGADLLRIGSSGTPGVFESIDGVGNITNYGIRTMVSDEALYLGTANPMNLNPQGGWELLRLRPHYALQLTPANTTTLVGTQRSFTATLTPAKQGVPVHFEVTGSNPMSADVPTNANGVATWSYTGTSAGVDTVTVTADPMGYGFAEDQLQATTSATWIKGLATVSGGAKTSTGTYTFSGTVSDAGTPVGSIQVSYGKRGKCLLAPDSDATIALTATSGALTNWSSDDLGTGACIDSPNVNITLTPQTGKANRGTIVIDIGANNTADKGDIGIPSPVRLTSGSIRITTTE
jgi:hypothetical protein